MRINYVNFTVQRFLTLQFSPLQKFRESMERTTVYYPIFRFILPSYV
jgi:hypothetical protein